MPLPITIHRGSELWNELEHAITDPKAYKVSIWDDEWNGEHSLKVKVNESRWSLPLRGES